jgi:CubicO group peptidase (beta-lactamase class C family)
VGINIEVHGDAESGFGAVVDEFRANFENHHEVGAALAVYRDGKPLIDIWAGARDREKKLPWQQDTLVPVFSTTKGMSALVLAVAVSQGILDYDEKVSTYWPEFAQEGKAEITVRQLIDHQAGLAAIDTPLKVRDLGDLDTLAPLLARQKPRWKPGTRHGYHPISLGLFQNELLRRADPQGRTVGQFLAQELAGPLGLDFHIGLPEDVDLDRVAVLTPSSPEVIARNLRDVPWRLGVDFAVQRIAGRKMLAVESLINPNIGNPSRATRRSFLSVELPSSNGVGSARAIAHAYSTAVSDSDSVFAPKVRARLAEPAPHTVPDMDEILHRPCRYHLGFRKPIRQFPFGTTPPRGQDGRAFGTTGLGGSFGFADPETGIGFGYVMNRLGIAILDEPRNRRIRNALFTTLGASTAGR